MKTVSFYIFIDDNALLDNDYTHTYYFSGPLHRLKMSRAEKPNSIIIMILFSDLNYE